uniref:Uncharacterized protein n=1 Tax=Steinernema glaseri TaxID=37863 RepID=A0A1I7Y8N7_9BILA
MYDATAANPSAHLPHCFPSACPPSAVLFLLTTERPPSPFRREYHHPLIIRSCPLITRLRTLRESVRVPPNRKVHLLLHGLRNKVDGTRRMYCRGEPATNWVGDGRTVVAVYGLEKALSTREDCVSPLTRHPRYHVRFGVGELIGFRSKTNTDANRFRA